jgi:hypothetical protein
MNHREYHPAYELSYWRDSNTGCDVIEATTVSIEVRDGMSVSRLLFSLPEESLNAQDCKRMLEIAFKRGERAARKDIRKCLGIEEPRR